MEALLLPSLTAASRCLDGNPEEKIFHIADHVFLGTKFGAADRDLLDALDIHAVVNLTAGASRVPNYFVKQGFEYIHIELADELISNPGQAIPRAYRAIKKFGVERKRVLVHCSAGLSRSATAVLSWLIRDRGLSLKEGKELFEVKRGRRPKCNPSFWCYLSALEREMNGWPHGTPPSFDWTPMLVEDMKGMGMQESEGKIVHAMREVADWVDFFSFYGVLCGRGVKHLMLAQCIAQREEPDAKAACRAAAAALEIMEVYHAWPALQAYALRVLQPLLCHPDARVREHILCLGAAAKTVAAMQAHQDANVQEAGCATLAYIANTSQKLAAEVRVVGGVACILGAMRSHTHEGVQAAGCVALVILLNNPLCAIQVQALGGASAVLAAMSAHPAASKVQKFCVSAIKALATHGGKAASEIVGLNGAPLVREAMQRHPELQTLGSQVLHLLRAEAVEAAEFARADLVGKGSLVDPAACGEAGSAGSDAERWCGA